MKKINSSIDIVKVIMALLVVGIHTEPLGFNLWLDRGFGIITRLCVPFFFVTSAFFCWLKEDHENAKKSILRLGVLYLVWSVIYLPFDLPKFREMSFLELLRLFLWDGNGHALWFLCGSIIAIIIVDLLLKVFKPKTILIISLLFLLIGCMKSTWKPLLFSLFHISLPDTLGSRNGLFYGFPYMALGMNLAKDPRWKAKSFLHTLIGLILSLICLILESFLFVVVYKTKTTILWFSVFPLSYYFFLFVYNLRIHLAKEQSLFLRKTSTLIYVSHHLFLAVFPNLQHLSLFLAVSICSILFSFLIIWLQKHPKLSFLKYLY